uniref:RecQ-mediated genome instability protein 1 n=1 Tax=Lates calcarifer TaxID=8187 RepID=A0A4W6GAL4_LATCA
MAPEIQGVVRATQAWLQSSWHVQVPFAWLEACVAWLQEEAGGAGRLSQQQINQQALDQWLLTDLRDLDYPVLPEGLAVAQKTELSGTFCVQVDSLLDISQPAYGQLQKWKGTECANDEVSAVTQTTQRPWEARPTRMLLLQVTDGVQSLEAMEYQPIPALSASLRPGAKLQLQGQMVCRLGMLLLGPSNIKVLGGEVEDLVDRNNQVGFCHLSKAGFYQTSCLVIIYLLVSSRSATSSFSYRSGLTHNSRRGPVQEQEDSDLFDTIPSEHEIQHEIQDHSMAEEDFPDEDFDDLPLDELDSMIFQQTANVTAQFDSSHRSTPQNSCRITGNPNSLGRATKPQTAQFEQHTLNGSGSLLGSGNSRSVTQKRDYQGCTKGAAATSTALEPSHKLEFITNDEKSSASSYTHTSKSSRSGTDLRLQGQSYTSNATDSNRLSTKKDPQSDSTVPVLTLTSPPFTYLCLLEELMSKPNPHTTEVRVKAFIVTLLGKLSSNNGVWSVCATISDGTGYLDVELSNKVLMGLLGFSVAEKAALKRDPARRGELDAGMRRCQEELVDMCCVMTMAVKPDGKAVVTKADQVTEKVLQELEQRVRDRRK